MNKKIKVAVIYNEAYPELYQYKTNLQECKLDFVPYFEVDNITPMDEYEDLVNRLKEEGFDAYSLNIVDDFKLLINNLEKEKPDVIFNFVEIYLNDAKLEMNIAGIYEILGIPYTGASPMGLANCQSKVLTKRILSSNKIKTADFFLVNEIQKSYRHKLKYPLIVKPAFEDASVGIENASVVKNYKLLKERIEHVILQYKQPALVEEFIEGRELNVAIIGDINPDVLPISEIDFSEMPEHLANIVSYQAKWDPLNEAYHKTIPICPAPLKDEIRIKVEETALAAFKLMGARDYSRIDIRLTKDDEVFVLEVNPNPDLTEGAGFMRSTETAGYTYNQTLVKIVSFALARGEKIKR